MVIMGIHDGHNSGATILVNGGVVASVLEERLSRTKNHVGYPEKSIEEVLDIAGLSSNDVDKYVYASDYMHTADHLNNVDQWYRAAAHDQELDRHKAVDKSKKNFEVRRTQRCEELINHLSVGVEKISFVDHHTAHAAAAYFGSHYKFDEKILIFTCDGSGDGLSATVSVATKNSIERISSTTRDNSLGKIYSRVTFHLGLTPWEHEYKVMGLAPYADPKYACEIRDILRELIEVDIDDLTFFNESELSTNYLYDYLRIKLERKRFDAIAGGMQLLAEEILKKWVEAAINKTGIRKIACGGGVFMNVKANKILTDIEMLDDIFVFPSCGDESLSFGAAWFEYSKCQNKSTKILPLKNLYLGRDHSSERLEGLMEKYRSRIEVTQPLDINTTIAKLLSENMVVARCVGKSEWGARALGNRSILANPSEWLNVEKINSKIKNRDFWMPFAPSILEEASDQILINEKKIKSRFMMHAFDVREGRERSIAAAIHPRDKTARAQIVCKNENPEYWEIINEFGNLTGTYCVLNTSFNLHGYPLVYSPADAMEVFLNSGLDYLVLNNLLITKKLVS